jgi:uncharacterized protein DUF4153
MGDELETLAPAPGMVSAPTATLVKIALTGVLFDVAANGQTPGVSAPIFLFVTAFLFWPEIVRSREDALLLCAGVGISVFAAVRAAPVLVALDLAVSLCLFALAAIPDARSIFRAPLLSFFRKALILCMAGFRAPAFVLLPFGRAASRAHLGRARPWLRAAAIAIPVVAIFGILLASADRVFGDLVTPVLPHWSVEPVIGHVFFIALGIVAAAMLARATFGPRAPSVHFPWHPPQLGVAEWISVLAGVNALFALFVGVQFAVLFGGAHRLRVTAGLTYAQYARTGFLQLIAVAALALLVILGAWDLGRRVSARDRRVFLGLTTVMVGFCGVILASALKRLLLYERAFGFTLSRFAATVVIAWVAFVLLAVLAAAWRGARDRVVAAVLTGAVAALLITNVVNPDRYIAQHNLARYERTGRIDVDYLGNAMSADAMPVIVSALKGISPFKGLPRDDVVRLRDELCARVLWLEGSDDVRSWNAGHSAARSALRSIGITRDTCSG